jgi:antimicrobial peptide system SdpA family protein
MNTSSAAWQANGTSEPAPPALQEEREDLRLGRRIATVGAIAVLFAAYVLHAALPAAPFQLPFVQKRLIQTVLPEGWAFFTLSPRSPDVVVFGAGPGGTWHQLTLNAHSGSGTLLGLNRRNRSQGTEVASVANQVPPEVWSECDRAPLDCLNTLTPQRTVPNTAIQKTLCGELGLIMQEVLPWAWRDLPANMPSKVVRVVVTC